VRTAVEGGKLGSVALAFEFLVRVDRPDSSMAGVLIAVLGPEMVQVVLEDLTRRIPGKLPLSLLNRDGIVMVSNDPAQKLLTKHTALARAGRHNATMGSGSFASRAADGTALLGTLGRLQGLKVGNQRETDWVVLGLMPESIITARVWHSVWTTFAPLLGASTLMLLVALGILRRIVRPLRQLGAAAGQVGQMGQLEQIGQTVRAQSVGDDEVGLLGLAFNHMIDDLQKAQQTQQAEHVKREQVELELRQSKAAIEQAQLNLKKSHDELVQRSWLSELLQSCVDVKEASAVIVRVAPNLFPDASGTLYLQTGAQPLLEQVAYWGAAAAAQNFGRDDCWALRRSVSHLAGQGGLCCPHTGPTPNATSLCLPLLARGESIGVLHLSGANLAPRRELAEGVAAMIAMSLAHLQLSDTLRQQMRKLELAERKAIEERRFLNQIIDKVADPIFVKDQQLRLILVNEAYCALTRMRREALIGSRAEDILTPEQAAVTRVQDESVLKSGQFEVHENLLTINGTNHTIQTKKSRLPMADGTHYLVH
jgi:PAS domain S-box-containing protein